MCVSRSASISREQIDLHSIKLGVLYYDSETDIMYAVIEWHTRIVEVEQSRRLSTGAMRKLFWETTLHIVVEQIAKGARLKVVIIVLDGERAIDKARPAARRAHMFVHLLDSAIKINSDIDLY